MDQPTATRADGRGSTINSEKSCLKPIDTFRNVYAVFGPNSGRLFTRGSASKPIPEGQWEPKFSISALDIQSGALIGHSTSHVRAKAERIKQAYTLYLVVNPQILDAITRRPAAKDATRLRWLGFKAQVQKIISGNDSDFSAGGTDDPIKDAKLLLQIGILEAAGMRAGVALEKHLKALCNQHQPPLPIGKGDGIQATNTQLFQAKVYDQVQFLEIQILSNIRNRSGHATENPPTREEIQKLLTETQNLMVKYPV